MTARAGMATLITELRQTTFAGTADFTLGATAYWSDDQLQTALDRTQQTLDFAPTDVHVKTVSAAAFYTDYAFKGYGRWFEENTVSSTAFVVRDQSGNAQGTANYSVNYQARVVQFNGGTVSTGGSAYYIDAKVYDLYAAAADVWGQKAAYLQQMTDWQSDNHRVAASQQIKHALSMQAFYKAESDSSVRHVRLFRDDEALTDVRDMGHDVQPDWHYRRRHGLDNEGWI